MAQKQNKNDTLLCTFKDCREPQHEDGEFCEEHMPSNTMCPLCEGKLIYHGVEHSHRFTHIYTCVGCSFIGLEYLNMDNLTDLISFLEKRK